MDIRDFFNRSSAKKPRLESANGKLLVKSISQIMPDAVKLDDLAAQSS